MMLFVDAISQGIPCLNMSFWVRDYESAFEKLTQLVAHQWTLQQATVVDGCERTAVPVEAIDGQPIDRHIRMLQYQWEHILRVHPTYLAERSGLLLKDWYIQLDAYYEEMLTHLEKMIFVLEVRKVKLINKRNGELRKHLSQHYDLLLTSNKRMHRQTKKSRRKNLNRLKNLTKTG